MVKCLTCGTDLGPAETYCPKCGTPKGKALTTDDRQKRMAEEALTYLRGLAPDRSPEEYSEAYGLASRYLIAKHPDTPERQKAAEEAAETYMATRLKETVMPKLPKPVGRPLTLAEVKELGLYAGEQFTMPEAVGVRVKHVVVTTTRMPDMPEATSIPGEQSLYLQYLPEWKGYYVVSFWKDMEIGKTRVLEEKLEAARRIAGLKEAGTATLEELMELRKGMFQEDLGGFRKALFNVVADPTDWKKPTKPIVLPSRDLAEVWADAIIYFVGGAEIRENPDGSFTVTSLGYRHYIAM